MESDRTFGRTPHACLSIEQRRCWYRRTSPSRAAGPEAVEFIGGRTRTRTLDPLIKSHHNINDFTKKFFRPVPGCAIADQKVISKFPTDERSITSVFPGKTDLMLSARCQRTTVSGRTITIALRTDGHHRYSRMKNCRSRLVNSIRPRTFRCSTTNWRRSAAFSTSSRLFGFKRAVKTDQMKQTSAIMVCQG
jgi:hypothetical protein